MANNLRSQAASKARVRLVASHQVEYQKLYAEECALLGLESRLSGTQLLQEIRQLEAKVKQLESAVAEGL